jgi:hypothetical protein
MNSARQVLSRCLQFGTGFQCAAILLLAASFASAQLQWIRQLPASSPSARANYAAAFDSARGVTVLFGGTPNYSTGFSDTWVYDGVNWEEKFPATHPSGRFDLAMAFDAVRGVTILFGGMTPSYDSLGDTWQWDGTTWTQLSPATSPPARRSHRMVYDSFRRRIVLFGGKVGFAGQVLDDTWEWDGANWIEQFPVHKPPALNRHGMAYDSVRKNSVLFGGGLAIGQDNDATYLWDGNDWILATPSTKPPTLEAMGVAYDSGRRVTVLFGGVRGDGTLLQDVWEWDGSNWAHVLPALGPSARGHMSLEYDSIRGRIVLFGGQQLNVTDVLSDTWELSAEPSTVVWTHRLPESSPSARAYHATAYDSARRVTVLFGGTPDFSTGFSDTWVFDGFNWVEKLPARHPSGRFEHAMAFDAARGVTILFGGLTPSYDSLADTWQWDGTTWTQLSPATSPPARRAHGMVYDSFRRRIVLFGGKVGFAGQVLDDTWEWDGANWIEQFPIHKPPELARHGMAYDSANRDTVLFGGFGPTSGFNDTTYLWDGNDWIAANPPTRPPAMEGMGMTYDSHRRVTVLFGGRGADGTLLKDVWEWDGNNWHHVLPALGPSALAHFPLAYDSTRGRVVLFGGQGQEVTDVFSDTWELFGTYARLRLDGIPKSPNDVHFTVLNAFGESGNLGLALLSCSGTSGFVLDGRIVPLTFDSCTAVGLGLHSALSGVVDDTGTVITPVISFPPIFAGLVVYSAAVTVDFAPGRLVSITPPISFVTQ